MKRILPVVLALFLQSCQAPDTPTVARKKSVKRSASTVAEKVDYIAKLTKNLSLTSRPELAQTGSSLSMLGSSLSKGEFTKISSVISVGSSTMLAAGTGNITGSGTSKYVLAAAPTFLHRALRADTYRLMGESQAGTGTVTWDDATGELTGIHDANYDMTYAFKNEGNKRSWTINLNKSADGSTGTATLTITASKWNPIPANQTYGVAGSQQASILIPTNRDDDFQADEDAAGTGTADTTATDTATYRLSQATGQIGPAGGIKLFGNELPDLGTVSDASITVEVTPQGNKDLQVSGSASLSDFDVYPNMSGRFPTRIKVEAHVPTLSFSNETTYKKTTVATSGKLSLKTANATEKFTYKANTTYDTMKGAAGAGAIKFDLTSENAGVRFNYEAKSLLTVTPTSAKPPVVTLYDADSGEKIGTMTAAANSPSTLRITFSGGKTVDWNPMGASFTAPSR